jgi:HTH-type transcriptional regulator/antitoxin HipB
LTFYADKDIWPHMSQLVRTPKQLGNALRRRRRDKGLTQTEAAERAGLRQELVSKIETGSLGTRVDSICALLAALDLEFIVQPRSRVSGADIEDIF